MTTPPDGDAGPPAPDQGPGKLGLTTAPMVATAALSGAVMGWLLVSTINLAGAAAPVTPISLPLTLAALAVAVFFYARRFRRRLLSPQSRIEPSEGLFAMVLGKTMVIMAAALAGGHLAYGGLDLGALQFHLPQQRVLWAAVTIVVSVLFGLAGRALERACVVPGSDAGHDDHNGGDSPPPP